MNIYELQNKGVKVNKVGTSTPAVSTPRLNIKDLPPAAIKKVAPPEEPGFIKQVLGDIYSAASTVGATVEQPLAAGAAVVGQNIGAGINKLRGVESKPTENYTDALARIRKEDEAFMKQNLPSSFDYKPANTPKEFAGAVLETGANVAGGGAGSQLVKQGFRRALKPLAVEGAAIFGTQNLGSELRKGKDVIESIPGALGSAAIGAVASPLLAVGGQKAVDAAMKYGGKLSPTIARDTLPTLFKNTTEKSQENLDRVLDYIAQPNFSSPKVRDSIEYVRSQFPNLQEEVALRSGSPIKTVKEGNKVKFQTANQADVIKNKAIAESQAASKLASTFDNQYKVSKNDVINEIDSVLSQTKGIDIPTLRAEMLKKINKDFVTLTVKPSKAEVARKNANTNRKEYNDADALLGKVYKNVLAKTIPDPQYLTSLRNSADNFDLSDLLFNLHNKTAEAERGALSKVTTGVGRAIETAGRIIPANVGSPLEYLGKAIKAIPELTSSERRLASDAITNLVTRAQKVGANISDNEQRVLNFARRLEQSNKTGTPIDINIDDINALKNLDEVKKYESAVSLFNKRFGEEVLTPDDNFGINLVKYYDRMQGATSKQKADITAELYKEILQGNKTAAKTVLPKMPVSTPKTSFLETPVEVPKRALPTIKNVEIAEENKYYENLLKQQEGKVLDVPETIKKDRIDEVARQIEELRLAKEFDQQAYQQLKDSFAGGGFNFKTYATMRNAGVRDMESLNNSGLGDAGKGVLRQLEDYAKESGDKDILEMMEQADEILALGKNLRGASGVKELMAQKKALTEAAREYSIRENQSVTDGWGKEYLGFNLKGMEEKAKEKGYNLFDALIKKVDSQDTVEGKIKGMQEILDEIVASKGKVNTIVTDEMYDNAKKNFKENMGRINSGIPVDQIKDLTVMAAYHIENGVRSAVELGTQLAKEGYKLSKEQVEKLYNGVSKSTISKLQPLAEPITSVNPTGGVLVDYTPQARMTAPLGENMTTLANSMKKKPDTMVTIYRGAPKTQKGINPGDFISTDRNSALSYAEDGNVISKKVRLGDILDDMDEPLGGDYLYRPGAFEEIGTKVRDITKSDWHKNYTKYLSDNKSKFPTIQSWLDGMKASGKPKQQLIDLWNKANGKN